jgi:leucyl aminopeptidase
VVKAMTDLKVMVSKAAAGEARGPLAAVPVKEGETGVSGALASIDARAGGIIAKTLGRGDFKGRKDETLVLYASQEDAPIERLVLVGLGKAADVDAERLRRAIGCAVRQAERLGVESFVVVADQVAEMTGLGTETAARVVAETAVIAAWDYRELKTAKPEGPPPTAVSTLTIFGSDGNAVSSIRPAAHEGEIRGRAVNFARGLQIRPGNVATPSFLANAARGLAERFDMKVTVLDRGDMEREGMKALLAVASGSQEEPRFIALEYRGAGDDSRPLVLIGKGVTFDAGGISLKPADRMEEMKYDMSGAAGVLGAMQGIAELGLHANVVALVPSTENLPDGRAVKPGDIIGSHLGKTIEVINTDAEGRLILADALSWARRYDPVAMVDAATLTGAVVIGLGQNAIGLMGNNDELVDEVRAAGQAAGDRCWPLPLWREYRDQLDSVFADIKNTGGRPAGSITAGWFLREFAGETIPWAHLDVAGTAYRDDPMPYLRKGPTGVPTRLFIEWVRSRSTG